MEKEQKFKFQMHEATGISIDVDDNFITYKGKTTTGQSGGPIVLLRDNKFYAVGIHIVSDLHTEKKYACHLTDLKRREINKWIQNIY